MYRADA